MIQGRAAIEQFWQAACRKAGAVRRTIDVQEIEASGDLGYVRSTVTVVAPSDGEGTIAVFKDITIWRRCGDRAWQLAVDISNHGLASPSFAASAGRAG